MIKKKTKMPRLSIMGKVIALAGVVIILAALCWMIIDPDKADHIVALWLPFIIAGILLVLLGIHSLENS